MLKLDDFSEEEVRDFAQLGFLTIARKTSFSEVLLGFFLNETSAEEFEVIAHTNAAYDEALGKLSKKLFLRYTVSDSKFYEHVGDEAREIITQVLKEMAENGAFL